MIELFQTLAAEIDSLQLAATEYDSKRLVTFHLVQLATMIFDSVKLETITAGLVRPKAIYDLLSLTTIARFCYDSRLKIFCDSLFPGGSSSSIKQSK